MRGEHREECQLFSYVSREDRVPKRHPLREARKLLDEVLAGLDHDSLYASSGHPLDPSERLIRASRLHVFYSIRSKRQLMEQLDYSLLFRWFVGLGTDEPV